MPTVIIGCRLPHGLTIKHPNPDVKVSVTLAGIHKTVLVKRDGTPAADFALTTVDLELWESWKKAYSDFTPLKTGAIFEAKNSQDAKLKADELKSEKTGFEPVDPKAFGVKPADKE
jgi:hypothetical protein